MGKFIVLDGIDGCGKTTQINKLYTYLIDKKIDCYLTKEPGGTEVGEVLRDILISTKYDIDPETELLLYFADRLEHQKKVIIPFLDRGKNIICDRFVSSTFAYQVYGRGLSYTKYEKLVEISVLRWPDITIILDISPELALRRSKERLLRSNLIEKEGKFELKGLDFFCKVREGFLRYAKKMENVFVVDASYSKDEVFYKILDVVEKVLV